MKRVLLRLSVLAAVFLVSLVIFVSLFNREVTMGTDSMEQPTLPVCYMEVSGTAVNRMFGTKTRLGGEGLREHLTPLGTERALKLLIAPYGQEISSVAYEVRSVDGETVVENGKLSGFAEEGEMEAAEFSLVNPIRMDKEYLLELQVDIGNGEPVYYYTRLVQRAKASVGGYLKFAEMFYRTCLDPERSGELGRYLESDASGTNNNFASVDIHSSAAQVGWGSLEPELYREAALSVKEINETTGSVQADYVISAENEEGQTEYYNVTDFYRMRYDQSEVLLLDFQRSARQRFDGELPVLNSTGLSLGVALKDTQYMNDKSGSILGFVEEGELWSYNRSVNKVTRVFSFRGGRESDERGENLSHGIKIVRVEENGDMDYVVFGYMNADRHEGQMGVGVYHYNAQQNASLEELFLPVAQSYDYLKEDVGSLAYVSRSGDFYVKLGSCLYKINMASGETAVIQEGLKEGCFVSSRSNQTVAWMDGEGENDSQSVTALDLETGKTMAVKAEENGRIKALGFLNEDLAYGLAREEDIITDGLGSTVFAMNTVKLQNIGGEVVKEYGQEGVWVSEGTVTGGLLELKRVRWENDRYVETTPDQIMNNLQQSEETISIKLSVGQRKGTVLLADFGDVGATRNLLELEGKFFRGNEAKELSVELKAAERPEFSVYTGGRLAGFYSDFSRAVEEADQGGGIVLKDQQTYIWERGNRESRKRLSEEGIPGAVLEGLLDAETLQERLGEEYSVISLEGCSMDSVLYFVSRGHAVIVKISETESAVMVGYDPNNTILHYPATGETKYFPSDDSRELFEANGNVFITYLEND